MTVSKEDEEKIFQAFKFAIEKIGLEKFKKCSFFLSNWKDCMIKEFNF